MPKVLFFVVLFVSISASAEIKLYSTIEPPQQMMEEGKLTGLGIDVVGAIQKEVGSTHKVKIMNWARSMAMAKKFPNSGIFLGAMTEDRKPHLLGIGPVLSKRYILYARADSDIVLHSLDEAKSIKSIAVMHDDVRDRFLRKNGFNNTSPTVDHAEGLRQLMNGRVDLWVNSDWEVDTNLHEAGITKDQIKPVLVIFEGTNYVLINKNSAPELIEQWRQAMRKIKDNGRMQTIADKWRLKLGMDLHFDPEVDAIAIHTH